MEIRANEEIDSWYTADQARDMDFIECFELARGMGSHISLDGWLWGRRHEMAIFGSEHNYCIIEKLFQQLSTRNVHLPSRMHEILIDGVIYNIVSILN